MKMISMMAAAASLLCACETYDDTNAMPNGPPPQTFICDGGKTFLLSMFIQADVLSVTAGGRQMVVRARNDNRPSIYTRGRVKLDMDAGETGDASLTGMPGGPYRNCKWTSAE